MIGRVTLIGGNMSEAARIAIHAAKHRHQWGRYATVAYCANRGVVLTYDGNTRGYL